MINKTELKDILNLVGDDTYDDWLDSYITKAYNKLNSLLDVTIESDDSITQDFLLENDSTLYVNLPISSVISVLDDSDKSYIYTHTKFKIIIDSSHTLDDTNLTVKYNTDETDDIDELATVYVLYYFGRRQDQNNDMFLKNKRTEDGLQVTGMPVYEFLDWFGCQARELLLWQA